MLISNSVYVGQYGKPVTSEMSASSEMHKLFLNRFENVSDSEAELSWMMHGTVIEVLYFGFFFFVSCHKLLVNFTSHLRYYCFGFVFPMECLL